MAFEDIMAFEMYGSTSSIPMSLKMLREGGTIKGSYTNLVDAMDDYPEGMKYVISYKQEGGKGVESITISDFTLSRENLLDVMSSSRNLALVTLPDRKPSESLEYLRSLTSWEELYAYLQRTNGYTATPRTPLPGETTPETPDVSPEVEPQPMTEAAQGKTTWYLTTNQAAAVGMQRLGTLQISPDSLHKTAAQYMEYLNDSITSLFEAVSALSENVNLYFISKERNQALQKGNKAIENAKTIETNMTKQTQETED